MIKQTDVVNYLANKKPFQASNILCIPIIQLFFV